MSTLVAMNSARGQVAAVLSGTPRSIQELQYQAQQLQTAVNGYDQQIDTFSDLLAEGQSDGYLLTPTDRAQAAALQQQHVWGQELMWKAGVRPREIAGTTLGLIGVGSIGRRVAEMASALGMRRQWVCRHRVNRRWLLHEKPRVRQLRRAVGRRLHLARQMRGPRWH